MVLQRPKMVVGAVSCAFFHTLVMCSGTVGVEKPARVRMPRPVKLERSGVMDEVMGLSDKEFKRFYRMDKTTFRFVLARVGPHLEAGDNHRGDEITPDIALACVLTWLRGGSYLDACRIHKVSINTFYPMAWRVVGAINAGLSHEMNFPIGNEAALNRLETRFRTRWGTNSFGLYKGCVGAIDGLVIKIKRPSNSRHHCPQSFFCGRYKCFGIAFQVIVGPDCEFLWSYGNAPGSVHDSVAFGMSQLYTRLKNNALSAKWHLAGDGAYCDESWLFTPYPEPRVGKQPADRDAFNWVHSSHRQCVERAFGMLVGRWLILEHVQKYEHTRVESVVHACMRLQNVCIANRQTAPCDDGKGSYELGTRGAVSRTFDGAGSVVPTFMLTSTVADANFAGLRTAAAQHAGDKKTKITKNLFDAGVRRPIGTTRRH